MYSLSFIKIIVSVLCLFQYTSSKPNKSYSFFNRNDTIENLFKNSHLTTKPATSAPEQPKIILPTTSTAATTTTLTNTTTPTTTTPSSTSVARSDNTSSTERSQKLGNIAVEKPQKSKNDRRKGTNIFGLSKTWLAVSASAVLGLLLALLCVFLLLRRYKSKGKLRQLIEVEIKEFTTGQFRASFVRNSVTGASSAQLFPFRNEISDEDIQLDFGKLLEQDNFLCVFPGTIKGREAILKLTDVKTEFPYFKQLLKDIKIMDYLRSRQHPNIVEFLGAEISNIHNRVIIAGFESSSLGSLKDILRQNSTDRQLVKTEETRKASVFNEKCKSVNTMTLLNWCEQITTAMVFLQQEKLVHGDLSASNIHLFPNNCVKISDLCSWRKEFERNHYIENFRPPPKWRWMAIELFRLKKFTVKTDVWAFGVTLWEIFSLGEDPHPGIKWSPEFVLDLENGYRMSIPAFANENINQMLLRCWYRYPNDRSDFFQLKGTIKDCIHSFKKL